MHSPHERVFSALCRQMRSPNNLRCQANPCAGVCPPCNPSSDIQPSSRPPSESHWEDVILVSHPFRSTDPYNGPTYHLLQTLAHLQVELEEKADNEGPLELHLPPRGRARKGDFIQNQPACCVEHLFIPGPVRGTGGDSVCQGSGSHRLG